MTVTWGDTSNHQITTDPDEDGVQVEPQFMGSFVRTANGTARVDEIITAYRITIRWSGLTEAQRQNIETVFAAKATPPGAGANILTLPSPAYTGRSWAVIGIHTGLQTATEGMAGDGTVRYTASMTLETE